MSSILRYLAHLARSSNRASRLALLLLLAVDLVFVILHFVILLNKDWVNYRFSLEYDGGYPEFFQYLKWLVLLLLMVWIALQQRSARHLPWVLIFMYFLLDDALNVHEDVGAYFAAYWHGVMTPPFGLRLEDVGELLTSVVVGGIVFLMLVVAWQSAGRDFKRFSGDLALLIVVLACFGVVIDLAHVAIDLGWKFNFVLGVVEDGGEMVTASLMLWYLVNHADQEGERLYLVSSWPGAAQVEKH